MPPLTVRLLRASGRTRPPPGCHPRRNSAGARCGATRAGSSPRPGTRTPSPPRARGRAPRPRPPSPPSPLSAREPPGRRPAAMGARHEGTCPARGRGGVGARGRGQRTRTRSPGQRASPPRGAWASESESEGPRMEATGTPAWTVGRGSVHPSLDSGQGAPGTLATGHDTPSRGRLADSNISGDHPSPDPTRKGRGRRRNASVERQWKAIPRPGEKRRYAFEPPNLKCA